jgi:hypothetical protein
MATDSVHGCPTRRVARATNNTTYRYLHTHVLENYEFAQEARAYHGAEYDMLWWADFMDLTGDEIDLSDRMRLYWTNFMKTGNPNGAGLRPWPAYDPAGERMLVMDTPIAEAAGYHAAQCAILDQAPTWNTCNTSICRRIMQWEGLQGWWANWGWFPDETRRPPPPRPPRSPRTVR